jgi:hypothetical protein
MSSCASHRLAEVAVGLAILLLLALLLVLWTGSSAAPTEQRSRNFGQNASAELQDGRAIFSKDLLRVQETAENDSESFFSLRLLMSCFRAPARENCTKADKHFARCLTFIGRLPQCVPFQYNTTRYYNTHVTLRLFFSFFLSFLFPFLFHHFDGVIISSFNVTFHTVRTTMIARKFFIGELLKVYFINVNC